MVNEEKTSETTQRLRAMDADSGLDGDSMVSYLVVLAGESVGRVIRLRNDCAVKAGRIRECELCFDCDNISREHALFEVDAKGKVIISDLGSTNGTLLNGKKIQSSPLVDGDRICMGNIILRYSSKDGLEFDFQKSLYHKATRDPLTNAFNKRYFMEEIKKEFAFHVRHEQPLSLMILDIDDFKKLNDLHGHVSGDLVLKSLTEQAHANLRHEDVFARFGGEEFVALFRFTKRETAISVATKLLSRVRNVEYSSDHGTFSVTFTVGVATLEENNYESPDELLMAADNNLYIGKGMGKNRVIG